MNVKTKKTALIMALLIALASCGGGGGGGGGTSAPTPNIPGPSTPNFPNFPSLPPESKYDSNGNIKWNDTKRKYDKNNVNNKTAATTQTGAGVKVGVLDVGFNTTTGGLQADINNKFGARLVKTNPHGTQTANEDHGIIVSEIIGGNTPNGIAKGVTIIAADASKKNSKGEFQPDPTVGMYNDLYNRGVKIFNQSFGIDSEVTNYKWDSTTVEHQIGKDILDFYKKGVREGALFIWAAGNESFHDNPSLEAGLPYHVKELEKGWINVVGLAKTSQFDPANTEWSEMKRLSGAGVAKNWSVTAVSGINFSSNGGQYGGNGSSFSAPMVTGTAALLKEKYPWMDGSLIRQTILSTATDIGKKGVDEDFGWGLLNIDKALRGPALFDRRLALGNNVVADVTAGIYTFSNDISGDAGLIKNGLGELVLSGKNTFTGGTKVNAGKLKIGNRYVSSLAITKLGTVETTENALLENGVSNEGVFVNSGSNTVIEGNYTASSLSKYVSNLGASTYVKGKVELNGSTLEIAPVKNGEEQYVTARGVQESILVSDNAINGKFSNIETAPLLNANTKNSEKRVDVTLSRKNVEEYVTSLETTDEMRRVAAQNIETS
ncbi:autotransporter outer membrane beta-barrel domain-containing protein, partial [Leptotrichia sp. OH3620_COT-345]|uniref:S8 family serine peptidase n=1 Tax=Leptotrichia sp. OH3620_COT-345 TaxID=2491048 RepID=UPI000F961C58